MKSILKKKEKKIIYQQILRIKIKEEKKIKFQ